MDKLDLVLARLTAIEERLAKLQEDFDDLPNADAFDDDSPEMQAAVAQMIEEAVKEPGRLPFEEYLRSRNWG